MTSVVRLYMATALNNSVTYLCIYLNAELNSQWSVIESTGVLVQTVAAITQDKQNKNKGEVII